MTTQGILKHSKLLLTVLKKRDKTTQITKLFLHPDWVTGV